MELSQQTEPRQISVPRLNSNHDTKLGLTILTDTNLSTQLPPIGNSPPTPNFFQSYADQYLSTKQFRLTNNNYNNYLSSTR
mgnify:CR=1 FL=1